jgi:hypothetical protein
MVTLHKPIRAVDEGTAGPARRPGTGQAGRARPNTPRAIRVALGATLSLTLLAGAAVGTIVQANRDAAPAVSLSSVGTVRPSTEFGPREYLTGEEWAVVNRAVGAPEGPGRLEYLPGERAGAVLTPPAGGGGTTPLIGLLP